MSSAVPLAAKSTSNRLDALKLSAIVGSMPFISASLLLSLLDQFNQSLAFFRRHAVLPGMQMRGNRFFQRAAKKCFQHALESETSGLFLVCRGA